jgi:hypothetical protein
MAAIGRFVVENRIILLLAGKHCFSPKYFFVAYTPTVDLDKRGVGTEGRTEWKKNICWA